MVSYQYQVGGRLPVEAPSYVARQADEELYQALAAGELCYVLNCRQMGKSSLQVRAAQRLRENNIACALVDLSGIGSRHTTPAQWYADIMMRLVRSFQLSNRLNLLRWLSQRQVLSPVGRLREFIEAVLLQQIPQPMVIFFDEIDATLSLDFDTDDFFALLRSCYSPYRLTFALLGVATPAALVTDKTRTPFNIGRGIALSGFQLPEAQPLARGLVGKVDNPQAVLKEILSWTGGQPFLTQKLCQLVVQSGVEKMTDDRMGMAEDSSPFIKKLVREALIHHSAIAVQIETLVESELIENWVAKDDPPHLRSISDRLLSNEQRAGHLLGMYQQVLHQEIPVDNSPEQIELLLSGLVIKQQGRLRVSNRIYQRVFNHDWIEKQLAKLRPYAQPLNAWATSGYQDESPLLQGQALADAQAWAAGKSLSVLDYRFLAASEERAKRAMQSALAAAEQANQVGNQISQAALQKQINSLRQELTLLKQEKNDLEILLETMTEHSDLVEEELHSKVITAREQSKEWFQTIAEATPVAILLSRVADGKILYANATAGVLLRRSASRLIGRCTLDFYRNPGDRQQLVSTVTRHRYVHNYELQVKRADGTLIWVTASLRQLIFNDEPTLLTALIDVTDRKQALDALGRAEAKYRSIFENALEGIFQITPEGQYISVNPAMAELLGYDSPEQMISLISDHRQIAVNPACRHQIRRLIEKHGEVKGFQYEACRRDGSLLWISESTRAVYDEATRKLLYFEGIAEDISDHKREEAALRRQVQQMQVEIDQRQRDCQVAEITQSDYFQELLLEVERLRLD